MPPATAPATAETHALLREAREMLATIDEDIVHSQVAISEIAAPTGSEGARARYVATRLTAAGLRITSDEVGNVIARREGSSDVAPVVLCAHLDTVFAADDDTIVRQEGTHLIGRGIGDNARGLAAMIAIAEVLERARQRTERPLVFLATVGEEALGDLRGAKHYFGGAGHETHAAIIVDGPGDERVVHRAVGSRRWRIRFTGPGGHSWSAYGLPNPLNAAGAVAAMLASIPVPAEPRTTLTVSRIVGGLSINAIPGDALVEIDLRSVSQDLIERLARETRAVVDTALGEENDRRARGTPPLECTVEMIGDRPGGETPESHELVTAAVEATRLIGRTPELGAASTDANVPIALGIPAIALGAGGRGGDAHTPQEWFENADGAAGIARLLTVACQAAGLDAR
ncbi:MAG: M20/M25/M40 family metallo-hydrolase [Gemmatimonadaceae bacterium]